MKKLQTPITYWVIEETDEIQSRAVLHIWCGLFWFWVVWLGVLWVFWWGFKTPHIVMALN